MRLSTSALALGAMVLGAFGVLGSRSASAQGATYKVVAFSGQATPDGRVFEAFEAPSIGADGTVGFIEFSNDEGYVFNIYSGLPGALRLVISSGDPVPGEPEATFEDFEHVSVARDGGVGFNAGVIKDDEYLLGIWSESGVGESSAPRDFSILNLGNVAFRSGTVFAKGLIAPDVDEEAVQEEVGAVMKEFSNGLGDVLREKTVVDGHFLKKIYPTGESSSSVGRSLDVNESGNMVLKAAVAPGPSPAPERLEAILSGSPASPKVVAMEGEEAPGLPGSLFRGFSPRPSIASNGLLAISARVTGHSAFSGDVIYAGAPGALSPIALENDSVPTTSGVVFDSLSDSVINATGDVIFRARISYPNESTRTGFWIKRLTGPPVLLAISGMTLPTPSGPQQVAHVDFAGPGTFNDLHQFVFLAYFESGDQGIYVADTRPGAPEVYVRSPRRPRDFVTTDRSVDVTGFALDDTGIEKVEYTVAREASSRKRVKKSDKNRKPKKMIVSREKLARGDRNWSFKVPLSMGLNLISIVATDKLGNESEPYKIRMLRYDPEAN